MTCDQVEGLIDDYVDGTLTGEGLHAVELHIASCAACREEERLLRTLIAKAAALPREKAPARDLWPGIAARLNERRETTAGWSHARRLLFSPPAGLAAAAAVVLAVLSVLAGRPAGEGTGPGPSGTIENVSSAGTPPPVLAAETDYVRATGQLMEALNGRRSGLAPETVKAVDDNLKTIDDALRQIRVALDKDPGNRQLTKMLASTHQKKLDLLLRFLKLTSQI